MNCRSLCGAVAGCVFDYTTPKIVTIRSLKVGLVNRLVQFVIIAYIIGYVIVWNKGYQTTDMAQSSVTTKVKGITSTKNRTGLDPPYQKVWDTADYSIPPQENNAFFVMTNVVITPSQRQGQCGEDPNLGSRIMCNASVNPCSDKKGQPVANGNGIYTGACNETTKTCQVFAWCPVEFDVLPKPLKSKALLAEAENFTVLIKNFIEFPKFGQHKRNIINSVNNASYLQKCFHNQDSDPYCPIFKLGDIVKGAGSDFQQLALKGGVISIRIRWNCDLDYSFDYCRPEYTFSRLDDEHVSLAPGWNFRYADKYRDENGTLVRDLYKAYGILFVMSVEGIAGKFDVVPLLLNIGSGLALLGLATILCDMVLLYCLKKKSYYKNKKFLTVVDEDFVKLAGKEDLTLVTSVDEITNAEAEIPDPPSSSDADNRTQATNA